MSEYRLTLAPGAQEQFAVDGRYIFVAVASHDFDLGINGGSFEPFEDGARYTHPERVTRLDIRNPGADPLTVAIKVSAGTYDRTVGKAVKVLTGSVSMGVAQDIEVNDVATLLATANSDRAALTVWAGEDDLWIGGTNALVAGTVGGMIPAGSSVELSTRGAIWGIRAAGITADAGILVEAAV